jgi:hypothetical protein
MKLSRFINHHLEDILIEWEAFARTLQPSSGNMSAEELRDHGKQILQHISTEIDSEQSPQQQERKSRRGWRRMPATPIPLPTYTERHVRSRALRCFSSSPRPARSTPPFTIHPIPVSLSGLRTVYNATMRSPSVTQDSVASSLPSI